MIQKIKNDLMNNIHTTKENRNIKKIQTTKSNHNL
jgi:hypothetical protein